MFISLKELKGLFTGLFAASNPRKIDGGATLTCTEVAVDDTAGGVVVAAASAVRRRVIIQNSVDQLVAVGPEGVSMADGHVLAACTAPGDGTGGEVVLFTQDAVYAIAGGAAREVRVLVEAD